MSLVLVYKIGSVSSQTALDQVLKAVPANGSASLRTGEAFTCRIWTKDALMALHNNRIVTLHASIGEFQSLHAPTAYTVENFTKEFVEDTLEKQAFAVATRLEPQIERGERQAAVLDSAPSSSSSSSRRR